MEKNNLEMKNINKRFPGVVALDNVNFSAEGGKVNCLVGMNGSGKSTLIKILSGVYRKDSGDIYINDKLCQIHSLADAKREKLNFIFQDTNLCENLTVFDNYTLGKEVTTLGYIRKKDAYRKIKENLKSMDIDINLNELVGNLTVAEKQIIEILKAVDEEAKAIIYDEATSSLTAHEKEKLFEIINHLKSKGIIIIFITHILDEIFEIGDTVTVLKDGKKVGDLEVSKIDKSELIEYMVGEKVETKKREKLDLKDKEVVLKIENLKTNKLNNINLKLHKGEILGLTGLLGSGYIDVCRVIYGLEMVKSGNVYIFDEKIKRFSPISMVEKDISLIPGKRREEGIFGVLNVLNNISVSSLKKISKFSVVSKKKEIKLVDNLIEQLNIVTPSRYKEVAELSGGNQQKVVLARWLARGSQIMLLVEPTHGIDVKAKSELYKILRQLAKGGLSIIISSAEYKEIAQNCDRVLIFKDGSIDKILTGEEISEKSIFVSIY